MSVKRSLSSCVATLALVLGVGCSAATRGAEPPTLIPAPALDNPKAGGALQTAVVAGGCFWGIQGVFEHVRGVRQVLAGYAGGSRPTAQYEQVSSGRTGHAESVQITFDPRELSYGELLQIYFSVAHDPTQLNRQGPDSGSQYRSAIFYADATQRRIAESYIAQLQQGKSFAAPIVTRVDGLEGFYPAEGYHQDFYLKNPHHPYIVINDLPKIRNLQALFPDRYRDPPASVAAR
ncbi:MAG TPA: peptide-methionine (S)-S-oxide reductase MsrA [Steroidobacteraceae bacterium]|jgi:peptide-methionine (S)-S-oxide reductase|nr:peptide-methionine (S)-S-oxide reductase MsrA [Steroidobacteraceae bacterium]